jgi:hypothetical protein
MSKEIDRRRANAKTILEEQLIRNTKPEKINKKTTNNMIPLTEGDKTRIKKEIEILSHPKKKKTSQ